MREVIKKMLVWGMVIVGVIFGGVDTAWAEKRALIVSPMSQRMLLTPGDTYTGALSVTNPMTATGDLRYAVSVGSYALKQAVGNKDDYGDYDISTQTAQNMIMDWITLDNEEGTLAPGEAATVAFTVDVPTDAPAGAQYATLIVRDVTDSDNETGVIREVVQMAHILYATVAGTTIENAAILENNIPAFVLDGNLETSAMLENSGNIYTDAEYILQVWPNGSDEEICTNEENAKERLVLPGTKRTLAESCKLPSPGIYQVKQTIRIFGEESVKEATVVYCPIWLILANLLGSSLIVIWAFLSLTEKKRAANKMMKKK